MNNEENKAPFDITQYPKEKYTTGKGEEIERYVLPDDVFEEYLKELPDNTINESKSFRAFHGGKLGIFGANPEADKEIQKKGAEALNAAKAQRRKIQETTDIILRMPAFPEDIEELGLKDGATMQDAMVMAQVRKSIIRCDTSAFIAVRDTAGEKPVETVDITADCKITEADQKLIDNWKNRRGFE